LGRADGPLPAASIFERVKESGQVNSRFMPRQKKSTAQLFRYDDLRRFRKVGMHEKWATYGLKESRYPEDDE